MQEPDEWNPSVVVGAAVAVGAGVGTLVVGADVVGAAVGAGDGFEVGGCETVGAGVGRDGTRHTRHPEATEIPSDDHEMLVDELTATQSGPQVPE